MSTRDPDRDCPLCPRLLRFREDTRVQEPDWYNAPVPTFGIMNARLLVVGLAPGIRGANRTGRPFTGDYAGDMLYATLLRFGFAAGVYDKRPDDGLVLVDCAVTNAVRCVPPQNKPLPDEIRSCQPFLESTIATMTKLEAIVALGRIAHETIIRASGGKRLAYPFGHGRGHDLAWPNGAHLKLFDSYHCSRYNTNTGVLTADMFHDVFSAARSHIDRTLTA